MKIKNRKPVLSLSNGLKIILPLIVLFSIINTSFAKATDSDLKTLAITPSVFETVVNQGEESTQTFELTNASKIPLSIKSYIRVFSASDEQGGVSIEDQADTQRFSISNWSQVEEPAFIIQPGQTKSTKVKFTPPVDLPPGGYYGILFFEPLLPEDFTTDSSLNIGGRIGALVFATASGDIAEKGSLASFTTPRYQFKKITNICSRFENDGNVYLRPKGQLTLKNVVVKGQQVIDVSEATVLPGKIREQCVSPSVTWPGIYQATVTLQYGKNKTDVRQTISFLYLPWQYIIMLLLLVLFLLVILSKKGRSRLTKAITIIFKGEKRSSE